MSDQRCFLSLFKYWILGSMRQILFHASLKFSPYCPHTAANFASPEIKFTLLRLRSKTLTSSKGINILLCKHFLTRLGSENCTKMKKIGLANFRQCILPSFRNTLTKSIFVIYDLLLVRTLA